MLESVVVGSGKQSVPFVMTALGLDYSATPWQQRSLDSLDDWQHESSPESRWWATYLILAHSLAEARSLLPLFRSEGKAERLVLVISGMATISVNNEKRPNQLAFGVKSGTKKYDSLDYSTIIEGDKWVNVHAAASAALDKAQRVKRQPTLGGIRVGIVLPGDREWLAGDGVSSLLTSELLHPSDDDIFAADVIVAPSKPSLPKIVGRREPDIWTPDVLDLPPVDVSLFNPIGFLPYPKGASTDLLRKDVIRHPLTESQIAGFRDAPYLMVDGRDFTDLERELSRWLTQLGCSGVPIIARELSPTVKNMMGEPITSAFTAFDLNDPPVVREAKSIDLRRTALEEYAPVQRWNRILSDVGRPVVKAPTVSVLLATRRPGNVARSLTQIDQQSWTQIEVILVLHGFTVDVTEVKQAVAAFAGQITVIEAPAEEVFGDVLNRGTAAASGKFITKMDDDDWYGEHHVRDLIDAAEYSGADLVGAQVEFVYMESLDITTRRPPAGEQYSDHVAGGTMMMRLSALLEVGGWRPVHRAVDRCLLQSVQSASGQIYRSHGQNYMMHRRSEPGLHGGHTWKPEDGTFLQSVADQWDGFRPPPQISGFHQGSRSPDFRSYYQSVDTRMRANHHE